MTRELDNIKDLPLPVQPVVSDFASKLLEILGNNVKTIAVYGSAAGINYHPGVSDVNMAVVVDCLDFPVLKQISPVVQRGRKHKIAVPLFLTKEYVLNSLDIFPIEYSEIKDRHKTIFGEDFFSALDIPLKDVRLFCEQQIKGKSLHLRQAYLNLASNPSALKGFFSGVFSDLVPVFRRLVCLKGEEPQEHKEQMLRQLAKLFTLDEGPLLAVYHDRNKKILISSRDVESHVQDFLSQLETLARHLDSL